MQADLTQPKQLVTLSPHPALTPVIAAVRAAVPASTDPASDDAHQERTRR